MKFKEMIMAIKVNGGKLFIAIEKGVGKHKTTIFLLIKPIRRREAKQWLRENLGTEFKFVNEKDRKCLVLILNNHKEISLYQIGISDFIKQEISSSQVLEHNNFKTKYLSYSKVV